MRLLLLVPCLLGVTSAVAGELRGRIDGGGRVYLSGPDGKNVFVSAADDTSKAIRYDVKRGLRSVERHTSVLGSFKAEIKGKHVLVVEKGKEFKPYRKEIDVGDDPLELDIKLERWITMSNRGWYSGETHVHRRVEDLKMLVLAEDLNVALPLTAWVTDSRETPATHNKNREPVPPAKLIEVTKENVIWPVNTEYEIFTVNGKRHTLGAVFVLNHKRAFTVTAPTVRPIAEAARKQGAILDLDKHNWPWSMMIVPEMKVGLYELTNNHIWRTEFMFAEWYADYARQLIGGKGPMSEREWIESGFRNYYALLNCGFDIKPSAGTASGVHPVPLGFGRVYVKLDGEFNYDAWMDGLANGRSFVTTGPMLECTVDGQHADKRLAKKLGDKVKLKGRVSSWDPLGGVEIVVNGDVVSMISPQPAFDLKTGYRIAFDNEIEVKGPSWIAVRAWQARKDRRPRFAHTAPFHIDVEGKPLRPKKAEVEYLIRRVSDEIVRHTDVLSDEALAEYRSALATYEHLLERAR